MSDAPKKASRTLIAISAVAPLILLGALVYWFFHGGSSLIERHVPPVEEVSIQRVEFTPGEIKLTIRNTGPLAVDMTVATVDEAIWKAEFSPGRHLERLQEATVRLPFDWVEGDPYIITLFTSNGLSFTKEVAVAAPTPRPTARLFWVFAVMGAYVGILPVMIGVLWLPFLRQLSGGWTHFLLSLTIGLLVFLGVEAASDSLELAHKLPGVFSGVALVAIGFLLAFMVITAVDRAARARVKARGGDTALILSYTVAFGIGVHNLGEGLAIGAAYASGEIALGALLLLGFTIHNTTEGLAIVAPLTRSRVSLLHLALLGLLGGAPAIIGCWVGGFTYSEFWAVFFLAVGAGAIFQVVWSIGRAMMKTPDGDPFTARNAAGFMTGMLLMYATAMLVAA
ncbi:MAG: divalent cation transporter [Planctomycetes bacterium]|nr:divalent cation transporter [Planctomycetota bacterium]